MPTFLSGLGDVTERWIKTEHGCLEYRFTPADGLELVHMDVADGHRRKGEASALVREAERMPGVRTVYGFVAATNFACLDMFVKLGYSAIQLPHFYGGDRHAVMVHKDLTEAIHERHATV